jgi:hypothetical protein
MEQNDDRRFAFADSVTQLGPGDRDRVALCGSHGGRYSASVALAAGVAAVVLNDASVGLDDAGIDGLALLDAYGVPGATVGHRSARIGVARDSWEQGTLSHVNACARAAGCRAGMRATDAAALLADAPDRRRDVGPVPRVEESRYRVDDGPPAVWALDSASLARPDDAGAVLVTGSHGQLVGEDPASALRADARAAVFNDAGGAVVPGRLEALDERGIPAVTVSAASARIGDGRSSYLDGVISAINAAAAADGAAVGIAARVYVTAVVGGAAEAVR